MYNLTAQSLVPDETKVNENGAGRAGNRGELSRIPESTIHKQGAGSGSDRVMVELRIEVQTRTYGCPGIVRLLPLPAPYLCGARSVVIPNS